jgi:hypothetical protein
MLLTVTAIALVAFADPPPRKEPPTQKELAAITERGRDLVQEMTPPKEDKGFFFVASKAIDIVLKDFTEHFEGEQRPYNVVVLPAENDQVFVYLVPAPTRAGVWPLGGDVRYLISVVSYAGILTLVYYDAKTSNGMKETVETPGVLIFGGAE